MIATILTNLRNTVIAGFVLAFVVFLIYLTQTEFNNYVFWPFLSRWFHILSGIMWIGMLWYFNFVQTPTMPKIPDELKGGVSRFIAKPFVIDEFIHITRALLPVNSNEMGAQSAS